MAEAGGKKPDSRGLAFFDITDFSPGIYDSSLIAFGSAPNTVPGIFPAPPGAADATATFGCIALPNGGLGPGPALGGSPGAGGFSMTSLGLSPGAVDITGLINSGMTGSEELVLTITGTVGSTQNMVIYSYVVGTASLNGIGAVTYTSTANPLTMCWPFTTTMATSAGGTQPVVVLCIGVPGTGTGNTYVYPPVNAATTFDLQELLDTGGGHNGGTYFGHQGRIVVMRLLSPIWPFDVPANNERWSYTEPAESSVIGLQNEVFGPEQPNGFGVVGSVSAGEAFAVKVRGGGVIVQGDLNNPTVTNLPGVQGTGPIYGRPGTDQNGLYYCSEHQGAWLWNGGNASSKISTQLDDNFFLVPNPISSYQSFYIQRWGDWMLFSNNWIYDTRTGGWWRLDDPSVKSFFWYTPSYNPVAMFAALPQVSSDSQPFLWEYDRRVPRSSFTWQSLPIKLPAEDRTGTVRELVIRASNPYADAAPQVIATLIDDKGNTSVLTTWPMATGIDTVQEVRLDAGVKQTTTVAVNLACSGTTYAPVVHGLSMGTRQREHLGAN